MTSLRRSNGQATRRKASKTVDVRNNSRCGGEPRCSPGRHSTGFKAWRGRVRSFLRHSLLAFPRRALRRPSESINRSFWSSAARRVEEVPWYTGVLSGAEMFIHSILARGSRGGQQTQYCRTDGGGEKTIILQKRTSRKNQVDMNGGNKGGPKLQVVTLALTLIVFLPLDRGHMVTQGVDVKDHGAHFRQFLTSPKTKRGRTPSICGTLTKNKPRNIGVVLSPQQGRLLACPLISCGLGCHPNVLGTARNDNNAAMGTA